MPKVAPLDDENTYYKYAYEARQRVEELAQKRAARQKAASGLFGKAAAVQRNVGELTDTHGREGTGFKVGDKAYDTLENLDESMQDDAAESERRALRKINELNGNSARAAKEQARWEKRQLRQKN